MRSSNLAILASGLFFCGLAFSGHSDAASVDFNLSNNSAQARFATVIGGTTVGRTETSVGFLYNDDEKYVVDFGLLVIDVAGSKTPGLEIGVGPRLYYGDGDNGNAVAIGLGGQLRYKFPRLPRINFGLDGFYAPDIVSFADSSYLYEVGARVGYEILPTADVYFGYRRIHADFDKGAETLDEAMMLGLKLAF